MLGHMLCLIIDFCLWFEECVPCQLGIPCRYISVSGVVFFKKTSGCGQNDPITFYGCLEICSIRVDFFNDK